jgi:hypothetical protein
MPNDSQKTPLFQSDDESMPLARSNKEGWHRNVEKAFGRNLTVTC